MADLTWWCIFIHLTTRTSTDGKRAPLTAISLQAVGSPKDAPPTYIAMWDVVTKKKIGKNVIFSQNHTEINSDDWTITKKTTRTIKHDNFSKMKILKVDRWALSLNWVDRIMRIVWNYSEHAIANLYSLRPSDAIWRHGHGSWTWRHGSGSTLGQVMVCCLTAPSHYLNQCWRIISRGQLH